MSAFLPQQDPHPTKREKHLEKERTKYVYNYSHVSPLAMCEHVPFHDKFAWSWLVQVAERALVEIANHMALEGDPIHHGYHKAKHGALLNLVSAATADAKGVLHLVRDSLRFHGRSSALHERPTSIEDFTDLFRTIGLPPVSKEYHLDSNFARMRIAGPNPVMIQRVETPDERFPVTQRDFQVALPGDSLEAAGKEGRLYLCDYQALKDVENGSYPESQKYIYAPLALFAIDTSTRELVPVAIQCKQKPAADNPIFTPGDGYNWLIAKTIVEIADANLHETVTHLARTHLFVEPFVISTYRQLAANHPIALLLLPHFEGTLIINSEAWGHLIQNHGACDKLFGGTIQSTRRLAVEGAQSFVFNDAMLPDTFRARGVDDPDLLRNYPFRDDTMLYWQAIGNWVRSFIQIYYQSDSDVQEDSELQNWYRELVAQDGGRVIGFGQSSAIQTVEYLINSLTLIIYTSSVQHAAVNTPQYDLMSYVPNFPLAGYAPAPTQKTGATEADYLEMLPPLDMAELQMNLGHLLGSVQYTTLGHYHWGHFHDRRVKQPLKTFGQELKEIGHTISERNESRQPYEYLLPAKIPQSINV